MVDARKLKKGPKKLPKFTNAGEELRFFESHDLAPYWDQLEDVDEVIVLSPGLERRIRARMKKRLVAIRLEEWQIARAKEAAVKMGVPYQALLRKWISSGMRLDLAPGGTFRRRKKALQG